MRRGRNKNIIHTLAGRTIALVAIACFAVGATAPLAIEPALAGNTYQNSYCDSFCDQLVDPSNGKVLGLNGQDGWSTADDEACALSEGASPTPDQNTGPLPMPSTQTQTFQCEWHAGQALNYCEAYVLPQQSLGFERTLSVLDTVTAATCLTACASSAVVPAVGEVCAAGAAASSAVEFFDTLAQENSSTAKDIQMSLSAIGGLTGIGDLSSFLHTQTVTVDSINSSNPGFTSNFGGNSILGSGKLGSQTGQQVSSNGNKLSSKGRRNACITGVMMTVLAALRLHNIQQQEDVQQSACNSIQGLHSNAPVVSPSGAVISTTTNSVSTPPQGAMAQVNGALSDGKQVSVACAANGLSGCGLSAQQLSTPDAQILGSGLAQSAAQQGAGQDLSGFLNQATAPGADPGAALGQALSGATSNPDVSKAISTLAEKAAQDTSALKSLGDVAAATSGPGGGSPAENTQAHGFDLSGFGGSSAISGISPEQTYEAPSSQGSAPSGDIFHTGYKGSIFQIVSQRMSSVRGQVSQLPWSTPLNRALAGDESSGPTTTQSQGGNP